VLLVVGGEAEAVCLAAGGGVDGAEPVDLTGRDPAERDLVGGVPETVVAHCREAPGRIAGLSRVTKDAVQAPVVVGMIPGPVVVKQLEAIEELSPAEVKRAREEDAAIGGAPTAKLDHALGERLRVVDVGGAGGGEITFRREVRTLVVLDALDELGDEEVEVGVALAVRVRSEVDRDALDRREEVGSVVEVEPAQEVLVRLSCAAVLGDDESRHELQNLARPEDGSLLDELARDLACACGVGGADRVVVVSGNHDLLGGLRLCATLVLLCRLCRRERRRVRNEDCRRAARGCATRSERSHASFLPERAGGCFDVCSETGRERESGARWAL